MFSPNNELFELESEPCWTKFKISTIEPIPCWWHPHVSFIWDLLMDGLGFWALGNVTINGLKIVFGRSKKGPRPIWIFFFSHGKGPSDSVLFFSSNSITNVSFNLFIFKVRRGLREMTIFLLLPNGQAGSCVDLY